MINSTPQALTIAGSDSDGSAGMQADLHTFFTRNVYGASVITACVAGNSYGIHASVPMPTDFIDQEFQDLTDDYHIKASKTGMLADSELIKNVVKNYQKGDFGPLVVDPVIMTKHGSQLLEESAFDTLRMALLPLATVITPNFYESQKIAEMTIRTDDDTITAAHKIQAMGAKNVIAKGPIAIPTRRSSGTTCYSNRAKASGSVNRTMTPTELTAPATRCRPASRRNWPRAPR